MYSTKKEIIIWVIPKSTTKIYPANCSCIEPTKLLSAEHHPALDRLRSVDLRKNNSITKSEL